MIVALIELEAAVIDQGMCVMLEFMSLLVTIITPIVYRVCGSSQGVQIPRIALRYPETGYS